MSKSAAHKTTSKSTSKKTPKTGVSSTKTPKSTLPASKRLGTAPVKPSEHSSTPGKSVSRVGKYHNAPRSSDGALPQLGFDTKHLDAAPPLSDADTLSNTNTILDHPGDIDNAAPDISTYQPRLFDMSTSAEASGKNIESLRKSRNQREEIVRMFGGVLPTSIMVAKKGSNMKTDPSAGTYTETMGRMSTNAPGTEAGSVKSFAVSGSGVAYGALSMFPRNICNAMVLLYSKPGDIVVDPFAGHNSRMETCVMNGRHYHGYDISERFMEYNFALADKLRPEFGMNVELFQDDSRFMRSTPDGLGDFTITSPPYWDIEDYGDEPEQLGKLGGYAKFLEGMGAVAKQNFRTLRPGAIAVYFINDFRRNGKFYAYHVHMLDLLLKAGFVQHDILIVDFGFPFRAIFAQQIIDERVLPKQHEYGLVMMKPE